MFALHAFVIIIKQARAFASHTFISLANEDTIRPLWASAHTNLHPVQRNSVTTDIEKAGAVDFVTLLLFQRLTFGGSSTQACMYICNDLRCAYCNTLCQVEERLIKPWLESSDERSSLASACQVSTHARLAIT
jgi:hypothetical protein